MTELYIIRHGIAVERGASELLDAKRPLTEKGCERIRAVAAGLRCLGVRLRRLYTSPWLRSLQTAELLTAELALDPPRVAEAMIPTSPKVQLLALLNRDDASSIALVGHEPYLSELTSHLIAGNEEASIEYRKGGVACLTYEGKLRAGSSTLRWLLTSKQLRLIASA